VEIYKQSIPSVHVGRGRVARRMISPGTRVVFVAFAASSASLSVSLTAASFCENFGVTQKPSQTWACFTRCLGKSGKAAKANSCVSDTRHALLYRDVCARARARTRVSDFMLVASNVEHSARFGAPRA